MKLLSLFFFVGMIHVSASVRAQEENVSFKSDQMTVGQVFTVIEKQQRYDIFYSDDEIDVKKTIVLTSRTMSVEEAIRLVLGEKYSYKFVGRTIVISPVKEDRDPVKKTIRIFGRVTDQNKLPLPGVTVQIKGMRLGTATDRNGKYVILSSVENPVLLFSFVGMESREIEYKGKGGQDSLNVVLVEKEASLDEVVITGYQVIDKRKNTSSIQSLNMEDIRLPGVSTIDKLLEGRVPGMIFMQNSGQVGAAPRLRVRGTSTVLGNQEPVWVLDGIILRDPVNVSPTLANNLDFVNLVGNAVSGINPDDIERIDILKDASATALYGAKAANGVIVITTKKGKSGPPSITYGMNGTFTARPRYGDRSVYMMNSRERIDYSREIVEKKLSYPNIPNWLGYEGALYSLYRGIYSYEEFQREVSRLEEVNTDWFDLITEDTFSHNHTLSLSGGSSNIRYYASVGYSNENGVIKREKNNRYSTMLKVNGNFDKFAFNFMIQANRGKRHYTNSGVNILDYAYHTSRAVPAYNEDGSLYYYNKKGGPDTRTDLAFNALDEMKYARDEYNNSGMTMTTDLTYKFNEHFRGQFVFSYGVNNTHEEVMMDERSWYAANLRGTNYGEVMPEMLKRSTWLPMGGEYREKNTRNDTYTARLQLDYNKFLDKGRRHLINTSLGFEMSSSEYRGKQQTHRGYLPERGKIFNAFDPQVYENFADWALASSKEARGVLTDDVQNEISGYFTFTYTLDNAYSFNFNTRADASNKFGDRSNDKILPVWSVSASWDLKESVLHDVNWVDVLSLRGSFGYQGNILSNQSPELIISKGEYNDFMGKYESEIAHYPNPNLKWEKTGSLNASVDFALFRNRLRGTLSYFYKKTKDAFLSKTVADINGVDSYVINSGTLENQGIEVSFNFTPVKAGAGVGGFRWDFDPQIGQVVNKLLTKAVNNKGFEEKVQDEIFYDDYLNGNALIQGEPLNTFFSYKFAGLSPEDGRPMFHGIENEELEEYLKMEREDVFRRVMKVSGSRVPELQGGFLNTFSYKRVSLSMNFSYSLGSKIRLLKLYENNRNGNSVAPLPERNVRKEFVHRWRKSGDEEKTNIPGLIPNSEYVNTLRPIWGLNNYSAVKFSKDIWQMYDNSDVRVVSGNYLKLQSVSFRYTLSDKLCQKLYLKSAYVGISGTNLFTVCNKKLKGQDPAQSGSSDVLNLSIRPTYSMNLSVTF